MGGVNRTRGGVLAKHLSFSVVSWGGTLECAKDLQQATLYWGPMPMVDSWGQVFQHPPSPGCPLILMGKVSGDRARGSIKHHTGES